MPKNSFALFSNRKELDSLERSQLIEQYKRVEAVSHEWIKRQILINNRIDILATYVLGYQLKPFHYAFQRFQFLHPLNLQLCYRGSGKSTICTIVKSIHLLLKNPNLRILIASKTTNNASSFLKEIKSHFESNVLLAEIFGEYYDPRKVTKWDNLQIEVLPRTSTKKEPSISCAGVEKAIVSKHFDVIFADDLVDEDNSRTEGMREKTKTWYYKVMHPTLEPPDNNVSHRGEMHHSGTRYHFDDLYAHLMKNELNGHFQIIKGLNEKGQTPWPEKHPPKWMLEKKKTYGIIIFGTQYLCDAEAMKGEVFQYDDCQLIEEDEVPKNLRIFIGVDLAISESEKADFFAIAVLGIDKLKNRYLLDWYEGHLRFGAQTKKIKEYYKIWDPIYVVVETNAYQLAQAQQLEDDKKSDVPLKKKTQIKDKMTRAWKLSPLFENKKFFFVKRGDYNHAIERFVLYPNCKKDLFDAVDLANLGAKSRRFRKRKTEPGVISAGRK